MFRAFTRPRYQVSVYRTIGPLVLSLNIYLFDKLYNTIQYNTIQYNTIPNNTIQYKEFTNWDPERSQKFSIIAFQNRSSNFWLKRIPVIRNFDVIVPIRCHGNKGNNSDLFWFKHRQLLGY